MEAEDLVVDKSGEWKVIKEIGEVFPDVGIAIFTQTFVVESVYLGNLARLVVAAENSDAARIADFQCYKEGNGFDGVVAAVDIVALVCDVSNSLHRCCRRRSLPMKR